MLQVTFILISRWRLDVLKPLEREGASHLLLGKTRRTGAVRNESVSARGNEERCCGVTRACWSLMKMPTTCYRFLCCEEIERSRGYAFPATTRLPNCLHPENSVRVWGRKGDIATMGFKWTDLVSSSLMPEWSPCLCIAPRDLSVGFSTD